MDAVWDVSDAQRLAATRIRIKSSTMVLRRELRLPLHSKVHQWEPEPPEAEESTEALITSRTSQRIRELLKRRETIKNYSQGQKPML